MTTSPRKQQIVQSSSKSNKSVASRVLADELHEENLWENPPEATSAMKRAIQQFKGRFNSNDKWDGSFSL